MSEVIEFFFNLPNPSNRSMAQGFTQPFYRDEYQEIILRVKRGRRIRLTTSLPSMGRFSRQYGILNYSQHYKPPRLVIGIALLSSRPSN
jgi:hypothetical protein